MPKETSERDPAAVELASGRKVRLIAIDQSYTYEGLLLGIPTREMNQETVNRLRVRCLRPGEYGVPLLLEPEQRPLDVPPHAQRIGTPARLPAVTCIARLKSDGLAGTDDIWSDFAFPIAERVLQQLAEMDWEARVTRRHPGASTAARRGTARPRFSRAGAATACAAPSSPAALCGSS